MTRIARIIIAAIALLIPGNALDYLQHHSTAPVAVLTCTAANVSGKAS